MFMTSQLNFLEFAYVIINLQDQKLTKSRLLWITRCKKSKLSDIFTNTFQIRKKTKIFHSVMTPMTRFTSNRNPFNLVI